MTFQNSKTYWWLFFIWPFLSLLLALRKKGLTPNLLWAFIVFYGLTFVISTDNRDADIVRYISGFENMYDHQTSFAEISSMFYSVKQDGYTDILQPVLSYIVSSFTRDRSILIAVFSLVFGFFYSRNVWLVLAQMDGRIKLLAAIFFLVLLLVVPFWNVNGFRFWTAAHIYFYGVYRYIVLNKRLGILFAISSFLVHFSFLIPISVFLIYLLLGRRVIVYFVFFIFSIFFNNLDIKYFREQAVDYMPTAFVERADSYTHEQVIERYQKKDTASKNWYAVYYTLALQWVVMIMLIVVFFSCRSILKQHSCWRGLFAFSLLVYGFANLISIVPSGIRFTTIANLFACGIIVILLQALPRDRILHRSLIFFLPALLLFIVVSIREGFNSIGVIALVSNPLIALFVQSETAFIDLFKWRF